MRKAITSERVRSSVRMVRAQLDWGRFVTLGAILICSGGLWVFVELADEMIEGETDALDRTLITVLRTADDPADPLGPPWLEEVFRDITALGGFAVVTLVAIVAVGYLAIVRQWATILFVLASLIGGTVLNNVLKYAFGRPRPDLVAHLVEVDTASFPSGHAMLSAVAYLTIGALLAEVQSHRLLKIYVFTVAVALTLLIGFSRVYLGVHWPTDVLAGWSIGAAWAIACWLIARFTAVYRGRRVD